MSALAASCGRDSANAKRPPSIHHEDHPGNGVRGLGCHSGRPKGPHLRRRWLGFVCVVMARNGCRARRQAVLLVTSTPSLVSERLQDFCSESLTGPVGTMADPAGRWPEAAFGECVRLELAFGQERLFILLATNG
jgi:hypothetical protein